MPKKALYAIILSIAFITFACSNRPKEVMSKREMCSFLYDLHVLEGAIMTDNSVSDREKAYYYHNLFEKHGISKAIFDSSVAYYTRDPKKFERIYLKVNQKIEDLQADVEAGKYQKYIPDSIRLRPDTIQIWHLDTCYFASFDSLKQQLQFSIKNQILLTKDVYLLTYYMRIHVKDTVDTASALLKIHYTGGLVDSLCHPILKDSLLKSYYFTFHAARNYEIDSLTGIFYTQKENADTFHISIDSIKLFRKYVPALQDSLRLQLDTFYINQDSLQEEDQMLQLDTMVNTVQDSLQKESSG